MLVIPLLSVDVIVVLPQASDAVAVPSAALISLCDGLQPSVLVVPFVVIMGPVISSAAQFTVLEAVAELPQASRAVHVRV